MNVVSNICELICDTGCAYGFIPSLHADICLQHKECCGLTYALPDGCIVVALAVHTCKDGLDQPSIDISGRPVPCADLPAFEIGVKLSERDHVLANDHATARPELLVGLKHFQIISIDLESSDWEMSLQNDLCQLLRSVSVSPTVDSWASVDDVICDYRLMFNAMHYHLAVSHIERTARFMKHAAHRGWRDIEHAAVVWCALLKIKQQCGEYEDATLLFDEFLKTQWQSQLSSQTIDTLDAIRLRLNQPDFGYANESLEYACHRFSKPDQLFHRNRFLWRRAIDDLARGNIAKNNDHMSRYVESTQGAPIQNANAHLVNSLASIFSGEQQEALGHATEYRRIQEDVFYRRMQIADPAIQGVLTGLKLEAYMLALTNEDAKHEVRTFLCQVDAEQMSIGIGDHADGLAELQILLDGFDDLRLLRSSTGQVRAILSGVPRGFQGLSEKLSSLTEAFGA